MFWLWNVCEQMVMHVRDKSVSSCSLVLYILACIWDSSTDLIFFIVLRSKLPRSRHQKCTDLKRAAVCWIPKRGMFLNLDYYSVSFESMLIMKWVYRRISVLSNFSVLNGCPWTHCVSQFCCSNITTSISIPDNFSVTVHLSFKRKVNMVG